MDEEIIDSSVRAADEGEPQFKFRSHQDAEDLLSDLRDVAKIANHAMSQLLFFELRVRTSIEKLEERSVPRNLPNAEQPTFTAQEFRELLTQKEVAKRVGVCENTLRKMCSDGGFPRPFHVGAKKVRFRRRDVETWFLGQWSKT